MKLLVSRPNQVLYICLAICVWLIFSLVVGREDAVYFFLQMLIGLLCLGWVIFSCIKLGKTIFHPLPMCSLILMWALVISPFIAVVTDHYLGLPPKDIDFKGWTINISFAYMLCVVFFTVGAFLGLDK